MKRIVEFCAGNTSYGTDQALRPLEEQGLCSVIEYGCLTSCGQCDQTPFALVNNEEVEAPTAKELYAAVLKRLRELETK